MTAVVRSMINLISQIVSTLQGILLDFKIWSLSLKYEISLQRVGKKAKVRGVQWESGLTGERVVKTNPHPFLTIFNRKKAHPL